MKTVAVLTTAVCAFAATLVTAQAATCRVPRAVLCEGCAARIVIRLQPGGGCRVSFTPTPASVTARTDGFVDLDVVTGARGAPHRLAAAHPARRALHRKLSNRSAPCFQFNGRQFCE